MNYIRLLSLFLIIPFLGQAQNERNKFYYYNEFIAHVNADVVGNSMYASNTGSGAGTTSTQVSADKNVIGVALSTTGSTSTGRAQITTGQNIFSFGGGSWVFEARIDSMSAVSSAGDRYQFAMGFLDNTTVNMTDAVYFLYDEGGVTSGSSASANWQCVAAEGGTREFTDSGVAVATTGQTLRIEIAPDASEAIYYIDGTEVDRNSTYIPESHKTEATGFGWMLIKSIGSNARTVGIDYLMIECNYNTTK